MTKKTVIEYVRGPGANKVLARALTHHCIPYSDGGWFIEVAGQIIPDRTLVTITDAGIELVPLELAAQGAANDKLLNDITAVWRSEPADPYLTHIRSRLRDNFPALTDLLDGL